MTLSHDKAPGGTCKSHKTRLGQIYFSNYKPAAAVALRTVLKRF